MTNLLVIRIVPQTAVDPDTFTNSYLNNSLGPLQITAYDLSFDSPTAGQSIGTATYIAPTSAPFPTSRQPVVTFCSAVAFTPVHARSDDNRRNRAAIRCRARGNRRERILSTGIGGHGDHSRQLGADIRKSADCGAMGKRFDSHPDSRRHGLLRCRDGCWIGPESQRLDSVSSVIFLACGSRPVGGPCCQYGDESLSPAAGSRTQWSGAIPTTAWHAACVRPAAQRGGAGLEQRRPRRAGYGDDHGGLQRKLDPSTPAGHAGRCFGHDGFRGGRNFSRHNRRFVRCRHRHGDPQSGTVR